MDFIKWLDDAVDKKKLTEETNDIKEWSYKVVIKSDKKVRDSFENDMDKLFKKYVPKTKDGYIEALYMKR